MPTTHLTAAHDHCLAPSRSIDAAFAPRAYGRLFPELPSLIADEAALWTLGEPGGACDGSLFADPEGDDAREVAAGWPFFGQFVAHDITADRSLPAHHVDAATLRNARRPTIDLECLYGDGPSGNPYLYDRTDPAKMLLGRNDAGQLADLPRNAQGLALIGDPRNDVHLFVSQLHVAMLKLHNRLVDWLREQGVSEADLFAETRRAARWHYQWVVLHDFLPRLIGAELIEDLLADGPRYFTADDGAIPLEFADAAYRYGHSQIRHRYRPNAGSAPMPLFPDLVGFNAVPAARVVDWALLFDFPGQPPAQRAKKIDGRLAHSLIELPLAITGEVDTAAYHSLAVRDLQRGQGSGSPRGRRSRGGWGSRRCAGRDRPRDFGLARRDAALVLHPEGGRCLPRRRAARRHRRTHRGRGPGQADRPRPRLLPRCQLWLDTDHPRRRPGQIRALRFAALRDEPRLRVFPRRTRGGAPLQAPTPSDQETGVLGGVPLCPAPGGTIRQMAPVFA